MKKLVSFLLAALLIAEPAFAAIVMNTPTTSSTAGDASFAHVTTVGATLLVVGCAVDENSITQTVTYGGLPLTLFASKQHSSANVSVWLYYRINPLTGSNTVVIDNSSGVNETNCVVVDFSGTALTAPGGAASDEVAIAQDTAIDVDVTCAVNNLAISMVGATSLTNWTPSGSRVATEVENASGSGAMQTQAGAGVTTLSEDPNSSELMAIAAACIEVAAVGGAKPRAAIIVE